MVEFMLSVILQSRWPKKRSYSKGFFQLKIAFLFTAMHQRIPSPRELQVHTQKILQRALIKKKLEEQQENYRKKQEMQQRGQSPNTNNNQTNKSVSSPTQFAFTPTSVLRKMTAEKDEGIK